MLPDIQDLRDSRGVALDEVGIANVRCPITFNDGVMLQNVVAEFDVVVALPASRRGTHMSRMVELVHDEFSELDPRALPVAMKAVVAKLDVGAASLTGRFPVSFAVTSPASGRISNQVADVSVQASISGDNVSVATQLTTQVTSLCPCSKAISDYGAHNQRSDVTVIVLGEGDTPYPLGLAELFERSRKVGSCPIYPLIKRVDERVITMDAYDHAAFVEDMARDLSLDLRRDGVGHDVVIRNYESIHSHDAVARVRWCVPR